MNKLRETFLDGLSDIYDAEKQLLKALPKMSQAASNESLRACFETHLEETHGHVQRLDQVFQVFGQKTKSRKCKAMKGLIEEAMEIMEEDGGAALIAAAQKLEHYEIAAYGALRSWAEVLGEEDAVQILTQTLDDEKAADEKLTEVAEIVNAEENEDQHAQEPRRVANKI